MDILPYCFAPTQLIRGADDATKGKRLVFRSMGQANGAPKDLQNEGVCFIQTAFSLEVWSCVGPNHAQKNAYGKSMSAWLKLFRNMWFWIHTRYHNPVKCGISPCRVTMAPWVINHLLYLFVQLPNARPNPPQHLLLGSRLRLTAGKWSRGSNCSYFCNIMC